MGSKALNGLSHASAAAHIGAKSETRLPAHQLFAVEPGPDQQRLDAALRQIDTLLILNALLKEESTLLVESLAKARKFAYHDALTGLPNRRLLLDHFTEAVARAARQHLQAVLLFLDLDDFKRINDTFGHAAADRLMQQFASRLTACIRSSDTACRYGGDEFVVLLPDIAGPEQAVAATEKIHSQLATPYIIGGTMIRMTASIGMAIYPIHGKDCVELIEAADMAMYCDKHSLAVSPDSDKAARGRTNGHSTPAQLPANVSRITA